MSFVGVDIGGMSVKCGIVDENGKLLYKKTAPIQAKAEENVILSDIATLISDTVRSSGETKIEGIGIGCPGSVDDEAGVVRYSCNINFRKTPLVATLQKLTGIKNIKVSNDANCAALGEAMFGVGKGTKNSVLVTIGTGVGTGIIVDGRLLKGNRSAGSEGGHIQIDIGGAMCGCGKTGHYEAYASATALMNQTKEAAELNPESYLAKYALEHGIDGKTVFICAEQGDKTAIKVLNRYIEYVGMGLVNFANIFFPEIIMIGGGISAEGEKFVRPLEKYVRENVYGAEYNPEISVVAATLKNDAGIIGAAALCMQ